MADISIPSSAPAIPPIEVPKHRPTVINVAGVGDVDEAGRLSSASCHHINNREHA